MDVDLLAAFSRPGASVRSVAEQVGRSRSAVSRALQALEASLGNALFLRHGRTLRLTRFGEVIVERAAQAQLALAALHAVVGDDRFSIATSPLFAERVLAEVLTAFSTHYPQLRLDVRLSHDYSEIFDDRVDVAIRRGPLADSTSLNARALGKTTLVCVAAPGLHYDSPTLAPWVRVATRLEPFVLKMGRNQVTLMPKVAVDNQHVALHLAREGIAVARLNAFLVEEHLRDGTLVEVFAEARTVETVYAVYPRPARQNGPLRTFLRLLTEACERSPLFDR